MFSRFFVHRPIFATSVSILIVLLGVVAFPFLPVAQYPDLTPPIIRVSTSYPGAGADVVADTVAAPIEQEVNGVDNMLYMSSTSASDGSYTLDVTFKLGTDVDIATVLVQNRVAIATPKLPEEVRQQGIKTEKQSTSFVVLVTAYATDDATDDQRAQYTDTYLSNYLTINVNDRMKRISGVGSTTIYPAKDYSMRVWLDPEKLKARNLTVEDVLAAVQEQNVQVAAGIIGQPPAPVGQAFQFSVRALGRLTEPSQFEDIIVRVSDRRIVRLGDVARVELGGKSYTTVASRKSEPAAVMLAYLAPGSNAVATAEEIRALIESVQRDLPPGLAVEISYDNSIFVTESMKEVATTLWQAALLVILVTVLFLQSFRASLIPVIVIPVALIGTFAIMAALGFSVNTLTMFGIVLSIGTVVDDAILVTENVDRIMLEEQLAPKEATVKALGQVTGAIVATSLVLMSVFLPTAAVPGLTGQMYRQFAIVIAGSTVLSTLNALTMSPAMCGVFLRPVNPDRKPNWFSRGFNAILGGVTAFYVGVVRISVNPKAIVFTMAGFVAVLSVTYWTLITVPTGFVPIEDRGIVLCEIRLPDAASQERTVQVLQKVEEIAGETEGVRDQVAFAGYGMLSGQGSNFASSFLMLDDWAERVESGRSLQVIMRELQARVNEIQAGTVIVFTLPAIDGLGNSSGFEMRVQDRAGLGFQMLQRVADDMSIAANSQANLTGVNSTFRASVPQLFADVDREKVKKLDIPLAGVFGTLQTYLGSAYVNDFNLFGRTYQVTLQAESQFRSRVDDILKLEVRTSRGEMVPLGTLLTVEDALGPDKVIRYNMFPAATILGQPAPGISSGQALDLMDQVALEELPPGMGFEWTGMAYQEKSVQGQAAVVFLLAIIMVYLILAAQYESWTAPISVILTVPLVLLGAMLFCYWRGLDNNIFTQIGLVLLVALGAKNAILIVEFARENRANGMGIVDSAVLAARQRFRPILMTSLSFIAGCIPLMVATGAGAASRVSLGTAVVGGMLSNTILGTLFAPALYVVVQSLSEGVGRLMGGSAPTRADGTGS